MSGHGVGKTAFASWAALWALYVRLAVVPCSAPTQHQLEDLLWPEMSKWIAKSPILQAALVQTGRRLRVKGTRAFAVARVANSPEGLAGFHGDQLLYILDEASGIPDETMAVVNGALTTANAYALMVGNPTRPTGYFVDAFGKNRERWITQHISSEHSTLVDQQWVADMRAEWGEDSDYFRIRVLGLPPMGEALGFFPPLLVREAMGEARRLEVAPDGPLELGLDVARYGGDKTALAAKRGWAITDLQTRQKFSTTQTTAWAAQYIRDHRESDQEPVVVRVDDGGVGGGVTDLLITMVLEGTLPNVDVHGMNFGGAGDRWYHTNAGVWADKIRQGLSQNLISLPDDHELFQQLTTRQFRTSIKGKIVLESKDDLRRRGLPSPDKGDAVMLAFAHSQAGGGWETAYGFVRCTECTELHREELATCPHCGATRVAH